jgi:hypothetical protein
VRQTAYIALKNIENAVPVEIVLEVKGFPLGKVLKQK